MSTLWPCPLRTLVVIRVPLEWEFVIDLTGPSISVQSPTGDYVASSDVLIEALVDDEVAGVDKVEVRVDGGARASATQTAPGVWSYEAEGLADGEYVIWVRATDNAGNQSAEAFTIVVDATALLSSASLLRRKV